MTDVGAPAMRTVPLAELEQVLDTVHRSARANVLRDQANGENHLNPPDQVRYGKLTLALQAAEAKLGAWIGTEPAREGPSQ